jgi:hypothetical protein
MVIEQVWMLLKAGEFKSSIKNLPDRLTCSQVGELLSSLQQTELD